MTRSRHALVAFLLLIAVSAADLGVTLHFNPSLSIEANPLVAQLGLQRAGLIASNALIVVVLGLGLLVYRQGPRNLPRIPAGDPWSHAAVGLYGRSMTRLQFWRAFLSCWPLPSNWHQFFRYAGFFTAWAVIAARVSAVFTWVAVHGYEWPWYGTLRERTAILGYPCLELLLGLLWGLFMIRVLAHSEYRLDHPGS